jgi:hypothetical protein
MRDKNFSLGTVTNLLTLIIGVVLGFLLGVGHGQQKVSAQVLQAAQPAAPQVEEIAPVITAGSAGFGTILANRIAADELMVQGVDLIQLDQNMINLLRAKGVGSFRDWDDLIERSRAKKLLRMKAPEQPKGGK